MASGTITAVQPEFQSQFDSSMFDLARWKPCTPEEYLRDMSRIAASVDDTGVDTIREELPDGRTRLVFEADVFAVIRGAESGIHPYLTVLYDPDTDKTTSFRRTDVCLTIDRDVPPRTRGRDRS